MKVTPETINGTPCTIIRRPFDPEAVRASLAIGVPVVVELLDEVGGSGPFVRPAMTSVRYTLYAMHGPNEPVQWYAGHCPGKGITDSILEGRIHSTITILPALPRYPTAADAPLLYRYAAEGLYPATDMDSSIWRWHFSIGVDSGANVDRRNAVLSHCVTADGRRVEVAIV